MAIQGRLNSHISAWCLQRLPLVATDARLNWYISANVGSSACNGFVNCSWKWYGHAPYLNCLFISGTVQLNHIILPKPSLLSNAVVCDVIYKKDAAILIFIIMQNIGNGSFAAWFETYCKVNAHSNCYHESYYWHNNVPGFNIDAYQYIGRK